MTKEEAGPSLESEQPARWQASVVVLRRTNSLLLLGYSSLISNRGTLFLNKVTCLTSWSWWVAVMMRSCLGVHRFAPISSQATIVRSQPPWRERERESERRTGWRRKKRIMALNARFDLPSGINPKKKRAPLPITGKSGTRREMDSLLDKTEKTLSPLSIPLSV